MAYSFLYEFLTVKKLKELLPDLEKFNIEFVFFVKIKSPSTSTFGYAGMIIQAGALRSKYSLAKDVKLILITLSQVRTNKGSSIKESKLL